MYETVKKFRDLLNQPEIIFAVGAFDGLSAKIAEKTGFNSVVFGGYSASASLLGQPDRGLLTETEMVRNLSYIAESSNLPIIADGDTGYGNPLNVIRTVKHFEKAGAAALFIEDQVTPKRCGHMENKQVISTHEYIQKLRAAVDARSNPDFVLIARTDARSVLGLEEAIKRANLAIEAGIDVTFIEAPLSISEMETIVKEVNAPQVANMIEGGKTPFLKIDELQKMGFKIAFYTLGVHYAVAKTIVDFMHNLKINGTSENYHDKMLSFGQFNDLVGLEEINKLENKYS